MRFFVKSWANLRIELDLDPNGTTVADLKTILIDQFRAQCSRLLRNDVFPSSITIYSGERKLGESNTLIECGIRPNSELTSTLASKQETRKRYGKGFDINDDYTHEYFSRREKMRKREQRRWKRAERGAQAGGDPDAEPCNHEEFFGDREAAQTAAGETKDMLQPQRKADSEAEETQSEEQIAEVEILVEDSGGLGNIQIGADPENSELVEVPWEDPYAQEDADKENWDPQILREAVRDRVLAQAEGA